jgi:hypothetical protein
VDLDESILSHVETLYDDLPFEVFRFCLDALVEKKKISLQEEIVSAYGRQVQLSPEDLRIKEAIELLFHQPGISRPPSPKSHPAFRQTRKR